MENKETWYKITSIGNANEIQDDRKIGKLVYSISEGELHVYIWLGKDEHSHKSGWHGSQALEHIVAKEIKGGYCKENSKKILNALKDYEFRSGLGGSYKSHSLIDMKISKPINKPKVINLEHYKVLANFGKY